MTGSAAWRDLSPAAVKLLVALQRLDHGGDNGKLFLSARKASEETGMSRNTVMNAFRDLEEHGFIVAVERGHFTVKGGPATRWRMTFVSAPAQSRAPTHEWQRWAPDGNKTRAQKLTRAGAIIEPPQGNADDTGAISEPVPLETSLVSVDQSGSISAPQVYCHGQGAESDVSGPWKHSKNTAAVSSESIGADLLAELRTMTRAVIEAGEPGTQTRLAAAASIPGGTLSKFLAGRPLARQHFIALQLALRGADKRRAA
jgi:hypothetical protein